MATVKWDNSLSAVSVLTTELNSKATGTAAITGTAVDVDTDHPMYGDFELLVTYGTNPTANSTVDLYLVRSVDGTNYEDGSTTGPILPQNGYVGSFVLRAVTTAQRLVVPKVDLPPLDFHVMVVNNSGQTMAASGNTLKLKPYRREIS